MGGGAPLRGAVPLPEGRTGPAAGARGAAQHHAPAGRHREDAEAWERGVNELASDDPEIAAYVQQLEEAKDTTDLPEATGDAIAKEFERYLRRRRDEK